MAARALNRAGSSSLHVGVVLWAAWLSAGGWGCDEPAPKPVSSAATTASAETSRLAPAGSSAFDDAGGDSGAAATASAAQPPSDEPPLSPATKPQELLALLPAVPGTVEQTAKDVSFLSRAIGPGTFGKMNQGNPEIARHEISKRKCLAGLRTVELQSAQQRKLCKGHPYMVPIYADGDMASAKACIDVFEFPNRPCELPFVWSSATQARGVCRALGKRLCTQDEWVTACSADPKGGPASNYAYGERLDLHACNTNRPKRTYQDEPCDPTTVKTTWNTCGTHTAPAGSFPRCRSRLGVFDQHGNVAEAMTRFDPSDERTYSQLKGSAFFYVDVHRTLDGERKKENYPDHCAHDPRWHVQPMTKAWHVNYHLGFRCCLSIED